MGEKAKMQWEKFYKKWAADVGSFIGQDVAPMWAKFVETADESVMLQAVDEIAEWFNNKNKRTDGYVANVTLYQLRETYQRKMKEIMPAEVNYCAKCNGEGNVFILDNGKYNDPDFPPKPGTPHVDCFCAIPCPVCQAHKYGANTALRQRVFDRCSPSSRRDELYSRHEVTA